jgi:hypothetical protein
MPITSWYDHLDEIMEDIETLRDLATPRFPQTHVEVTPAPPEPVDALERMHKRVSTHLFLSMAGVDDDNTANFADGHVACVAHVYSRDGHTAKHGEKIERNRLAATICEQLHVILRDPAQYMIDAPTGREWQVGRGDDIRIRNLSFRGGKQSADAHGLAHWVVTWSAAMRSEPLSPDDLADLTRIDIDVSGAEFGGSNHDTDDDEETRVTYS